MQGILRHLEATHFGTAAIPLGELAACLHFPRYMLFFSLNVLPGEKRRVIYSSLGFAVWLAALYSSPSCAATDSKNQEEKVQRFSVHHTVNVLQDQHLLEASDLLWRCWAAVRVCDGSAPFKRGRFAERVQTICPGKPQRKAPALVPHTGWQWSCLPTGKDHSCVRVDLQRGRAFPDEDQISGVTGFLCPPGYCDLAQFVLPARFSFGLVLHMWPCGVVRPPEKQAQGLQSTVRLSLL